jgi:hypothetical protein
MRPHQWDEFDSWDEGMKGLPVPLMGDGSGQGQGGQQVSPAATAG